MYLNFFYKSVYFFLILTLSNSIIEKVTFVS